MKTRNKKPLKNGYTKHKIESHYMGAEVVEQQF